VVGYTDAPCYAHDITASSRTQWRQEIVNKRSCRRCVRTQARKLSKHCVRQLLQFLALRGVQFVKKIHLISWCKILPVQFEKTKREYFGLLKEIAPRKKKNNNKISASTSVHNDN